MAWKKWVKLALVIAVAVTVVFIGLAEWGLRRINEAYTQDEIIALQLNQKSLFGSALTDKNEPLKLMVGTAKHPDIAVFGSSRIMPIRSGFFKDASFYNFALSVGTLSDLIYAADFVLDTAPPKIAIIGLDLWDFDTQWVNRSVHALSLETPIESRQYLYWYLAKKFCTEERVRQAILSPDLMEYDVLGKRKTIGLRAAGHTQSGCREDGSAQWAQVILEPSTYAEKMAETRQMLQEETSIFKFADISPIALYRFQDLLRHCKKHGCEAVVLITPFPLETYQILSLKNDIYIERFLCATKYICEEENVPYYDFLNPAPVGAEPDEAVDGLHSSEKTYARILLAMQENNSPLAGYINKEHLAECLEKADNPFYILPYDE